LLVKIHPTRLSAAKHFDSRHYPFKTIFRLAAQRARGVFGQQIGELVMKILPHAPIGG
jgi:hypothetical protein